MPKSPLPFEKAQHVVHMAADVFGHGDAHDQVLKTLGRQDPAGTFMPFSVAILINYLSKTTWPDAWPWANQIDKLVQTMAHEGVLAEMPSGPVPSPVLGRSYLRVSGLTRGQSAGKLWMTPILGVPLLLDAVQASLIHLTGRTQAGDVRGGTGFALSPRHILTAGHVIDDMTLDRRLVVPQRHKPSVEIQVLKEDRHSNHDLALVTVDDSDVELTQPLGLVARNPEWSDQIYLMGFPPIPMSRTADLTVQSGEVVAPKITTYDGADLFLYSAVARPGSSGGPIFAHDGRLIGMVTRELSQQNAEFTAPSFYAGLPARVISSCLKELGFSELIQEETWE